MVEPSESLCARQAQLIDLLTYKAWANSITFDAVAELSPDEVLRPRATRFGNILHTLNHIWVVEDIFRHHVAGRQRQYSARNTDAPPPLSELHARVQDMDRWWIAFARDVGPEALDKVVHFTFVGGGEGVMTRAEIMLHLVNHATYHRGFVGDMLYQAQAVPPATDLTVYLREARKP